MFASPGRIQVVHSPRILLVDDEPTVQTALRPPLTASGYEVVSAMSGRAALDAVERYAPDVVVLDLDLPDMDGIDVCRLIRDERLVPIIVLSVHGAEKEKARALGDCADDYVTKPFGSAELLARIRVALGGSDAGRLVGAQITLGDLVIDRDRHRVVRGNDTIHLTPKEFDLLLFLAQYPGRVLTHRAILKAVWGPHAVDQPEHLRVLVNALRRKIEKDPARPAYIMTEPWIGYRLADG